MDPNYVITKSITNIVKKYMSKDVVMMFTNSKKSGDKLLLKNHEFHRCLLVKTINVFNFTIKLVFLIKILEEVF